MRFRSLLLLALLFAAFSFFLCHCDDEKVEKTEKGSEPPQTSEKASPLDSFSVDQLVQEFTKGSEARKKAREQLTARGKEVSDDLIRYFDSSEFTIRWEVANFLGSLRDPKGVESLVDHVLRDDNSHVRWRSLWALTQITDPTIPDRFRKELDNEDGTIRWNAAVGSSMFDVREALPVIYEGLKSSDEFAAWEGVNALSRMHEKDSVEHLREVLARPSLRLKRETAISLGKMRYPDARDLLVETLDDEDSGVRWRAAMSLSNFKDDLVRKALEARQKVETDKEVIKHIDNSLRQIGTSQ
jgi:HEAT repeat protein